MRYLLLLAFAGAAVALASPLYPPSRDRVVFSHATHGSRALACTDCHAGAMTSQSAVDNLAPAEAVCARCHTIDRAAPLGPACALCHADGADGTVARVFVATPAVVFSHRQHQTAPCATCHGTSTEPTLPAMDVCMQCHRGSAVGARREAPSAACDRCHAATGDGTLRTSEVPALQLKAPQLFAPLRPQTFAGGSPHGSDFARAHGPAARLPSAQCDSCHRPDACAQCHAGTVAPAAIHPPGFVQMHARAQQTAATNCSACHRKQTFCVACHERSGVGLRADSAFVRGGPDRTTTIASFHPMGWEQSHGRAARQRIDTCASCHRDDQCAQCHSAEAGAPAANPHGPGFGQAGACRSLSAGNGRMCLRCHTRGIPLCQ